MHDQPRRTFLRNASAITLTTIGSGLFAAPASAQSAEFKLKFASNLPATHPLNVRIKEAAEAIHKESNGRVDI